MEINQADRDALRKAQQRISPSFRIGNIIEHKVQDPRRYKQASIKSQQQNGVGCGLPKVHYKSLYLDDNGESARDENNHEQKLEELPITIEDVHANMWLNMDKMEFDKLEWMTNKADRVHQEKMKSTTHFDREGRALPPNAIIKEGDQVHDIGSLVKLLDSTYPPQVTYSLNVISKIATLSLMGYYDSAFDENIHQILLKECLLRVRRHIDNTNETICLSALKCLRSLLCNAPVDEVFLDRTHPLHSAREGGNWLQTIEMASEEFTDEMTDNQCVEIDAILALVVRTDILTRFSYLLRVKTGPFSETYRDCIMDILLRIARHSQEICYVLIDAKIHKLVIDEFMPVVIVSAGKAKQCLAFRAIKLVRILTQASKELQLEETGRDMKIPEEIMKPIECYYHLDCFNLPKENENYLFVLHIETLRLMTMLLLTPQYGKRIFDVVMMNLDYLTRSLNIISKLKSHQPITARISLDWQLAAHLIDLLGHAVTHELYHSYGRAVKSIWGSHIGPISMQWLRDLVEYELVPHLDVSIALASVVSHVKNKSLKSDYGVECFDTLEPLLFSSNDMSTDSSTNAGLRLFNKLLASATEKSHLLNYLKISGNQRDPKMLPSFGCLIYNSSPYYDYKFNNVIENDSPYVLLDMYIEMLLKSELRETQEFGNNYLVIRYIKSCCAKYHELPLEYERAVQKSSLAQMEIEIMAKLLLVLAKNYRFVSSRDLMTNEPETILQLKLPEEDRFECYSSIMFNAVSLIALMSPDLQYMNTLKGELIEGIIFNEVLHRKLEEIYLSRKRPEKSTTIEVNEQLRPLFDDRRMDFLQTNLRLMKLLYLQCEQPNRFWLFQPLAEYYTAQIKDCDESNRDTSGRWFAKAINKPGEVSSDADVINAILLLNRSLIVHSPAYYSSVVRPNMEEFLCLIGTVFLDDNLFHDEHLSREIERNIRTILGKYLPDNHIFPDASKKIHSLNLILVDFFNKIVDQYEAASYGDKTFSNYLLLFLNPKCDKVFKKKLLSEKVETCLSQVRLLSTEVWCWRHFTNQREEDPEIRTLIRAAGPYVERDSFLARFISHNTQSID